MSTRVVVVGAAGRMGATASRCFFNDPAFALVGMVDRSPSDSSEFGLPIESDLSACLERSKPDVMLEFTIGKTAGQHALTAVKMGIPVVIGATGVPAEDIEALKTATTKAPCILVPNFSIGAVLMMQFSAMAAKYLPDAEIIELHHEKKVDAPSGTAMKTAPASRATTEGSGSQRSHGQRRHHPLGSPPGALGSPRGSLRRSRRIAHHPTRFDGSFVF